MTEYQIGRIQYLRFKRREFYWFYVKEPCKLKRQRIDRKISKISAELWELTDNPIYLNGT